MTFAPVEYLTLALGVLLVALSVALGYRVWKASRVTPEEAERRRRAILVEQGKINDAILVEFRESGAACEARSQCASARNRRRWFGIRYHSSNPL